MGLASRAHNSLSDRIVSRVFVVGCPRSGTTLLQTMLASHPQIFSSPESHFFTKGHVEKWYQKLGIRRPQRAIEDLRSSIKHRDLFEIAHSRKAIKDFLRAIDRPDLFKMVPLWRPSFASYSSCFVEIMDTLAIEKGKDIWVEKTPSHLAKIDVIERTVQSPKFIHILRDGRDVVASLYEAASQRPDVWGKWVSIDECVWGWNHDIQLSLAKIGSEHHFLMFYEELIADPRNILVALCQFLSIPFDEAMLSFQQAAAEIVGWREIYPWMRDVFRPLRDARGEKFSTKFTDAQQQDIAKRLLYGGDVRSGVKPRSDNQNRSYQS